MTVFKDWIFYPNSNVEALTLDFSKCADYNGIFGRQLPQPGLSRLSQCKLNPYDFDSDSPAFLKREAWEFRNFFYN